jgi:hypothetical protein
MLAEGREDRVTDKQTEGYANLIHPKEADRYNKMMAEVMGWHLCKEDPDQWCWEDESTIHTKYEHWNPWSDIGQAVMVAEKVGREGGFRILYTPWRDKPWGINQFEEKTLSQAICRAVEVWKEDHETFTRDDEEG